MATTTKWTTTESLTAALTTGLNSLANGSLSAASSAIDNTSGLYTHIALELVLASLTPTGTPYCLVYLNVSADGTNYEDLTTSSEHAILAVLPFSTASAAKRVVRGNLLIPPLKFKLALQNQAGPSLASSGNTLSYARYYLQQV